MARKDLDSEINYIAKHYKSRLFNTENALRKIKPVIRKFWSLPRIATACSIVFVLGATAALLIRNTHYSKPSEEIQNTISPALPSESVSKVIDFDDAPLPMVIEQISLVYNVEIGNIPENAEDYRLSLHYEGNALDLIETINEILGIKLEIQK